MTENKSLEFPISREKLYELAWSQPMTSIAKMLDVSSSYLARIYSRLNVPRPAPGYWAKVAVGKQPRIPPLPEADPENAGGWERHNWGFYERVKPLPRSARPKVISDTATKTPLSSDVHPLLRGIREHFLKTRPSRISYLRPFKRNLVDLIVSQVNFDKAVKIANILFNAFEVHGFRVALSPSFYMYDRAPVDEREKPDKKDRWFVDHWVPGKSTVVYIGTVAIGLTLFEFSESIEMERVNGEYMPVSAIKKRKGPLDPYRWTTWEDVASGRFCLQAYSPYRGTDWKHQWPIPADQNVTEFAKSVVMELSTQAESIVKMVERHEQEAARQRAQWEEEERQRREEEIARTHKEAVESSCKALLKAIEHWGEMKRIEVFFEQAEAAVGRESEERQVLLRDRLKLAKDSLGSTDAFEVLEQWKSPQEQFEELIRRTWWFKGDLNS